MLPTLAIVTLRPPNVHAALTPTTPVMFALVARAATRSAAADAAAAPGRPVMIAGAKLPAAVVAPTLTSCPVRAPASVPAAVVALTPGSVTVASVPPPAPTRAQDADTMTGTPSAVPPLN